MRFANTVIPITLALPASTHFVLNSPKPIGFDDTKEATAPCGGFDVKQRDDASDYPAQGNFFSILTTHPHATWDLKAALLNDTHTWTWMVPPVVQEGVGNVCFTGIPGPAAWEGQDGVVQVTQHAPDGALYQCAAVKFTSSAATAVPGSCSNSTGVQASFTILPAGATILPIPTDGGEMPLPTLHDEARKSQGQAWSPALPAIFAIAAMACLG